MKDVALTLFEAIRSFWGACRSESSGIWGPGRWCVREIDREGHGQVITSSMLAGQAWCPPRSLGAGCWFGGGTWPWPESWRLQRSIAGFSWDAEAGSWNVLESGDAVPLLLFYQLQAAFVLRQVSGADAQIRDVVAVDADDSACRGKTCVKLSTVSSERTGLDRLAAYVRAHKTVIDLFTDMLERFPSANESSEYVSRIVTGQTDKFGILSELTTFRESEDRKIMNQSTILAMTAKIEVMHALMTRHGVLLPQSLSSCFIAGHILPGREPRGKTGVNMHKLDPAARYVGDRMSFWCVSVPRLNLTEPQQPPPTGWTHCLGGVGSWGRCSQGQFLCLTNPDAVPFMPSWGYSARTCCIIACVHTYTCMWIHHACTMHAHMRICMRVCIHAHVHAYTGRSCCYH